VIWSLALIFVGWVGSVVAQNKPTGLPTPADLKTLPYQGTLQRDLSIPSHQEIVTVINLARGYSRGNQLIPLHHEPVLTRGASGIAVFRSVSPTVVLIITGDVKQKKFEPSGLGAGVILDSSGTILTNWHVINGYSAAVIFLKPEGSAEAQERDAYAARVIAEDEVTDLAVLRMIKPPTNLRSLSIGNISSVQVAEDIHVIGHPEGNLWSYSTGVVSQVRDHYDWTYSDGSKHEAKVLQLQTAINPGNSGGPVVDDQGKLLGLVAMGEEGQNLDYAIAADVIQNFLGRSTALSTRGGVAETKSSDAKYSTARLRDGRDVIKASYSDVDEYLILDEAGKVFGFMAEASDGTHLSAWDPNSFNFTEWEISLPNGVVVRGRGNSEIPDQFSSK
jgi:S1-C subfamily serine protease